MFLQVLMNRGVHPCYGTLALRDRKDLNPEDLSDPLCKPISISNIVRPVQLRAKHNATMRPDNDSHARLVSSSNQHVLQPSRSI